MVLQGDLEDEKQRQLLNFRPKYRLMKECVLGLQSRIFRCAYRLLSEFQSKAFGANPVAK